MEILSTAAPRVAVIAIGTELLEGQTVNKNAAWLSHELALLGANTVWHFAVRDDFDEILRAFEWASREAEFLITTGGLGPTSDDFTREVIAYFLGVELIPNMDVQSKVKNKLTSRHVKFLPMHDRQCRFPAGAILFENPVGTAEGFAIDSGGQKWVALPGPPNEMAGCWTTGARAWIQARIKVPEPKKLRTWTCLGVPESDLATLVEQYWPRAEYEVGYRTKPPYVEFKLWLTNEEYQLHSLRITQMEQALGARLVWVGEGDITDRIVQAMPKVNHMVLIDTVSDGYWASRWTEGVWLRLQPRPTLTLSQRREELNQLAIPVQKSSEDGILVMSLCEDPDDEAKSLLCFEMGSQNETLILQHERVRRRDSRGAKELFAEMALAEINRILATHATIQGI